MANSMSQFSRSAVALTIGVSLFVLLLGAEYVVGRHFQSPSGNTISGVMLPMGWHALPQKGNAIVCGSKTAVPTGFIFNTAGNQCAGVVNPLGKSLNLAVPALVAMLVALIISRSLRPQTQEVESTDD